MPERMIEAAYRERLAGRRQRELDLRELHADFTEVARTYAIGATIIAVGRPEFPQSAPPTSSVEAASTFDAAWSTQWRTAFDPLAFAPSRQLHGTPPQRGLRRYRQVGRRKVPFLGDTSEQMAAVAEIHNDGTVSVAFSRAGYFGRDIRGELEVTAVPDLEHVLLDLFVLAEAVVGLRNSPADYIVRLSVDRSSGLYRHPDPVFRGNFEEVARHPPFSPIEGIFVLTEGIRPAIESLVALGRDAVSQTDAETDLVPEWLLTTHHGGI
jgi:hypothetical protein